jgi:hypothetical protein
MLIIPETYSVLSGNNYYPIFINSGIEGTIVNAAPNPKIAYPTITIHNSLGKKTGDGPIKKNDNPIATDPTISHNLYNNYVLIIL